MFFASKFHPKRDDNKYSLERRRRKRKRRREYAEPIKVNTLDRSFFEPPPRAAEKNRRRKKKKKEEEEEEASTSKQASLLPLLFLPIFSFFPFLDVPKIYLRKRASLSLQHLFVRLFVSSLFRLSVGREKGLMRLIVQKNRSCLLK